MSAPIVIATGGTGGHVFPAQALAGELTTRGRRLVLVTDSRGDAYHGPLGSLETYTISAAGVSGKSIGQRIGAVVKLARGFFQARALLRRIGPAAAVGFGGYPSIPTMMAATGIRGLRTAIHEQNAVLGRANRLLAARVDRIALSFESTSELDQEDRSKAIWTGNPVREEIAALANNDYSAPTNDGPLRVLVLGGSQGAQILGEVVPAAINALPEALRQRVVVDQQVREEQLAEVRRAYEGAGIRCDVRPFFDDMPTRLRTAHLMVGRAGASTMAELTTVGLPAILVPYQYAVDDHQTANAARLCDAAGAWMIPQADMTPETLSARLEQLLGSPAVLASAAAASARIGMPEATRRLADMVEALIGNDDTAGTTSAAEKENKEAAA